MRPKIKIYFEKGTDIDNIFSEFFSSCASIRRVFEKINEKKILAKRIRNFK